MDVIHGRSSSVVMDVIQGSSSDVIPGHTSPAALDVILKQSSFTLSNWAHYCAEHPSLLKDYEETLKTLTDLSLAHYNLKHKSCFEVVEYLYLKCVTGLMDSYPGYNHLSFIAKTVDPPHRLKLFFAEVRCLPSKGASMIYVECCTPVDPDTPFFTLGCAYCHPRGVIYHPLGGCDVGGYRDDSVRDRRYLSPAEVSAKELLREKYTFKFSNQYLPPDEDKDLRKIFDGYARKVLREQGFAVKLIKVVKAVRFSDSKPQCLEDAEAWVHMLFLAEDAFCDAPELFFAEYSIDCPLVSTCVRLKKADLGSKAETSCMLCRESCPMFHPEDKYHAGIGGGTFVDALDEQRSWGVRVHLEEKQPPVATPRGLSITEQ